MNFAAILISWYQKNHRSLPWRETKLPYRIWLSEIILQQTRVEQGMRYYEAFINQYPTVQDLAQASEDEVLKLWQGLGYYSRARNLYFTAQQITEKHAGVFPEKYSELLKLKGVGKYTAAAIASICYEESVPVVDGNVYRVLSRVFGIRTPIDSTQGAREFRELAEKLIDPTQPSTFNQALMEFGAMHCTPSNPGCETCPFATQCIALNEDTVKQLPIKAKKLKQRDRFFNYLVLQQNGSVLLNKRTGKDIWHGLHDFPLIETKAKVGKLELLESTEFLKLLGTNDYVIRSQSAYFTHILSHQRIIARFWEIEISEALRDAHLFVEVPASDFGQFAVPRLIEKFWNGRKDQGL